MRVPYVNLGVQYKEIKDDILKDISELLDSGQFILGDAVTDFEKEISKLSRAKFALGLNSGTDALILAMKALGIGKGDEVIVPPNSYLATASTVALVGAKPVFADVKVDFNIDPEEIKKKITSKTKAIVAVHLTGRPADMDEIMSIAKEHELHVLEDAAQAIGAEYKGQPVGAIGIAGGFSLHPLKNLGAPGDGGVMVTNSEEVYDYCVKARNHGLKDRNTCEFWSYNSRLDTISAVVLLHKLKKLKDWNRRRNEIAQIYNDSLRNFVKVPEITDDRFSVYHTYIIQTDKRDELMNYLSSNDIDSKIHYPIPIHLQPAAEYLGNKEGDYPVTEYQRDRILSLPVYPELTDDQLNKVISAITDFFNK
ncbi:MAG: DegT/DnrJ/EryC1/StrS family aminotransferase [Cytophagales bacterium]